MMSYPIGIVAGSGIGLESLLSERHEAVSFRSLFPALPPRVPGHAGTFVKGRCRSTGVIIQSGRLHIYEGLTYNAVVRTVDALASWGVRTIIFTNAVGGLLPDMEPGDLVAVDSLHLWPCRQWQPRAKSCSPDFLVEGCDLRGRYMWVPGPNYETRAEIRALQTIGGAVVGMSVAPEVHRCRTLGIRCAIVSCVTNNCCMPQVLTHDAVIAAASEASARLCSLLRACLSSITPVRA